MNNSKIRQEIIDSLKVLSDEQLWQVKELINQNFFPPITIKSEEERKQLIHSFRGKYAHINTSSEDFAQRKH